jgi:N-acetylglucosamine kinase-like BadF-type ATPase
VRRALHACDREELTQILKKVGEIWGTPSLDDLVNMGNSTPGPDFAALAPAVNELAEAGDPVAAGVLQQAAADLVEFVLLVRTKLRSKHGIAGEVPVAWTGGVVEKMTLVREAFFSGLHASGAGDAGGTGAGSISGRCVVAGKAAGGSGGRQHFHFCSLTRSGAPASFVHHNWMSNPVHPCRSQGK